MATDVTNAKQLERDLTELLEVERFPPPEEFRERALVNDLSLHEEAEHDFVAFWAKQADELVDWFEKPKQTLNDSNAPFYKWFEDGKLNVSHNCLDRHVEAGNGDKVAFHWRGAEGQDGDDQAAGGREDRRRLLDRDDLRGQGDRCRLRDAGGSRRLVPRGPQGGRRRV